MLVLAGASTTMISSFSDLSSRILGTQSQGDTPGVLLGYSPPAHPLVSRCAYFRSLLPPPVPQAAVRPCILKRWW